MDIVVINLACETARWAAVRRQFEALGLPVRRVDAVAGHALTPQQRAALYSETLNREQYHQPLCAGEIGCYASHLGLWEALHRSRADCIAVFEDDVTLQPDLPVVLRALQHLDGPWDMVKLIGREREKLLQARPFASGRQLVRYRRAPSLTGAYILHRRGAQKLLMHRPPFGRPVDVDLRHWWECGLDLLGVWPYPVQAAPQAQSSTIEDREMQRDLASRWRRLKQQASYSLNNWQALRTLDEDDVPQWPLPGTAHASMASRRDWA